MEQGTDTGGVKGMLRIHGFEEAVRMLEDLSTRDQKNLLLRVMRKALKPIPSAARANLGGYSSRVHKAIKVWVPRGARRGDNPRMFVGVKSNWRGYGDPVDPWFAHIIEEGTDGVKKHSRSGRKVPDQQGDDYTFFRINASRTRVGQSYRKAKAPRPFWGPAIQQEAPGVGQMMIDDMGKEILLQIDKLKPRV